MLKERSVKHMTITVKCIKPIDEFSKGKRYIADVLKGGYGLYIDGYMYTNDEWIKYFKVA
jgi:hypothetical protein